MRSVGAIPMNPGVELAEGPRGLRLRGPALAIVETLQRLRSLQEKPEGYQATLGTWTLVVSEYVLDSLPERVVSMPGRAWNVAASVSSDVAYGQYENPFDFGDVGFLGLALAPDFGVEIVGELLA